ncbi:MAG: carbohydrate kinase [Verrucomicrobia bacterium]|nr:carbohydrate kinase [Verrucomicrobiota bacterium]MBU1855872.1 carbohydrate kinase [Verrucomicrobiota bacterium]
MKVPCRDKIPLKAILDAVSRVRIAVIGDFCLDTYWFIDASAAETSVETGLLTRPVRRQRYTLGGAGNVIMNLLAMNVHDVHAFGVIGDDPFGQEMLRLLKAGAVIVDGMLTQKDDWNTHVYTKPYVGNQEESRIDFGNFNRLDQTVGRRLLELLEERLNAVDLIIVNEQVASGIHGSEFFRGQLAKLMARHAARIFLLDSRNHSDAYTGAVRKLNAHEAIKLCGTPRAPDELVMYAEARQAAETLFQRWQRPVFVTRGARGCMVMDTAGLREVPGLQILGRTDPVGAGDSMLAGIAVALAAGYDPFAAATLGNFVSGVTVQKLFQTGTAAPAEIMAIGTDPDYLYRIELAEDPRQAQYLDQTEIEIITALPQPGGFTHAIFDHDGTISTLRQGWEQIMEPMMMRAVLGDRFQHADETLYHKVVQRVREYIDKTTGIQTITQMEGLVAMVREFACVPSDQVRDAAGYKAIYNDHLMALVRERIAKLRRGELAVEDYTLKHAVAFLRVLYRAGLQLFLASGTDAQDVMDEAATLGYADLFEGRIYGAIGDAAREAKKFVLDRILNDIGAEHAGHLVTFGDGPVEIRETQKRGGYTVGIASDEVRRFGLNREKRARLICAGADLIIPDYSQMSQVLKVFGFPAAVP